MRRILSAVNGLVERGKSKMSHGPAQVFQAELTVPPSLDTEAIKEATMDEKSPEAPGTTELDLVGDWMTSVGGGISIGDSKLKSAKVSKSGDKLTIVLKKKSQKTKVGQGVQPSNP